MGRSFNPSGGGVTPFEGQEILSSFTPPPLQAAVNNYVVAQRGFLNASLLSLSATAAVNITGLQGAVPNRELTLLNTGASAITLKNANGASLAANRFNFGADVVVSQNQSIVLLGLAAGGWGIKGAAGSSGGGGAPSTATYFTATDETATLPDSVLLQPTGALVRLTTDVPFVASTAATVAYDTVIYDTADFYAVSHPTRLTAPAAGLYLLQASGEWGSAAASGFASLSFQVNGSSATLWGADGIPFGTFVFPQICASVTLKLDAGDFVEVSGFQNSSGPVSLLGASATQACTFNMTQVH